MAAIIPVLTLGIEAASKVVIAISEKLESDHAAVVFKQETEHKQHMAIYQPFGELPRGFCATPASVFGQMLVTGDAAPRSPLPDVILPGDKPAEAFCVSVGAEALPSEVRNNTEEMFQVTCEEMPGWEEWMAAGDVIELPIQVPNKATIILTGNSDEQTICHKCCFDRQTARTIVITMTTTEVLPR